jgi:hypothetical protein
MQAGSLKLGVEFNEFNTLLNVSKSCWLQTGCRFQPGFMACSTGDHAGPAASLLRIVSAAADGFAVMPPVGQSPHRRGGAPRRHALN